MDVSSSGCPLQNFLTSKALSLQIHSEGFFIERNRNLKFVKAQKEKPKSKSNKLGVSSSSLHSHYLVPRSSLCVPLSCPTNCSRG